MTQLRGIKRLLGLDTTPFLTLSLYLDVDGKKFPNREFQIQLKALLHEAHDQLSDYPQEILDAAFKDLSSAERFVVSEFTPSAAGRTLALFACSPKKLFETFTCHVLMKNRIILSTKPHVTPLLTAVASVPDALVIMANRSSARFFLFESGHLEELSQIQDEVPAQVRVGGWKGYSERHIERHIDEHVSWHLKHVAEESRQYHELYAPDLILLSGPSDVTPALLRWMPATLQPKIATPSTVYFESGHIKDIEEYVHNSIKSFRINKYKEIIHQIIEKQPKMATIGVEHTLDALNAFRVASLTFDAELVIPGFRCTGCNYIATNMTHCPRCQKPMVSEEDLIPEAVELAFQQGADLVPLMEAADLAKEILRMGSLLRY